VGEVFEKEGRGTVSPNNGDHARENPHSFLGLHEKVSGIKEQRKGYFKDKKKDCRACRGEGDQTSSPVDVRSIGKNLDAQTHRRKGRSPKGNSAPDQVLINLPI